MRYLLFGLLGLILTALLLLGAVLWHRWKIYLSLKGRNLTIELRGLGLRKKLLEKDFSQKAEPPKSKGTSAEKKENPILSRWKEDKKRIYDPNKGGYQPGGPAALIAEYRHLWEDARESFAAVFDGLRYKIWVEETEIRLEFGTGNPAHTGMAYGAIWSALGVFYPLLCGYVKMDYPKLELEPNFNVPRFHLEITSIIKVRPAHIIHIILKEYGRMAVTYLWEKIKKGSGEHGRKQTSD